MAFEYERGSVCLWCVPRVATMTTASSTTTREAEVLATATASADTPFTVQSPPIRQHKPYVIAVVCCLKNRGRDNTAVSQLTSPPPANPSQSCICQLGQSRISPLHPS